jgi:hypothetical protein
MSIYRVSLKLQVKLPVKLLEVANSIGDSLPERILTVTHSDPVSSFV